jgi:uncharacterized protein YggL (DUF469 family)
MNNIKETSLFAYDQVKPHLGYQQEFVYSLLKYYPNGITAKEISTMLRKPINSVVARVNELMYEKQLIKIAKVENNQSYYTIRSASDPINIRKKTPDQKLNEFKSWLKCQGLFVSTTEAITKLESIIKS